MSDRLAEIRARLDARTPGEWVIEHGEYISAVGPHKFPHVIACVERYTETGCDHRKDAVFIAHAPADIAWLLDRVAELEKRVRMYEVVKS